MGKVTDIDQWPYVNRPKLMINQAGLTWQQDGEWFVRLWGSHGQPPPPEQYAVIVECVEQARWPELAMLLRLLGTRVKT